MITIPVNEQHHHVYSISSSEQHQYIKHNKSKPNSKQRSRYLNRGNRLVNQSIKDGSQHYISISSEKENKAAESTKLKQNNTVYKHICFKRDELINNKYKFKEILGEGSFGRVIEAEYQNKNYAIKLIKPHKRSIEYGQVQARILRKINQNDPNAQFGIVRLFQTFQYHQYYCLVFQSLGQNLYKVIQTNNLVGYSMKLVQSFFKQILTSIQFLHQLGYTHTDLKPENVVFVNKNYNTRTIYQHLEQVQELIIEPITDQIKIIDLGNAVHDTQHHTPIINTRQYRSPQVILSCCQWDHSSDVWAIGCLVAQLLTGKLTFPAKQDVEHLHLIKYFCGSFPRWMINRSQKYEHVFDKPKDIPFSITTQLKFQRIQLINEQISKFKQFTELIKRCLEIDPRKRITCKEALEHEFFKINY